MDSREMDENVEVDIGFKAIMWWKNEAYICKLSTKES